MYIKYPKEIFSIEELTKEELLFPCIVFIMKYESKDNKINSTIGCILNEFNISQISRNTDRVKSCLLKLEKYEVINIDSTLDKINTPLLLTVNDFGSWVALHDFEIEVIKSIYNKKQISYKVGDVFMAIKQNAHNANPRERNINRYGSVKYAYKTIMYWSGISSPTTLTKYITELSKTNILDVKKQIIEKKSGKVITHEYSFKEIP